MTHGGDAAHENGRAMNAILLNMQRDGLLDAPAAEKAEVLLAEGKTLDDALASASGLADERLLRYLADEFGVPYVDLETRHPDAAFLAEFPVRVLLAHRLLPLAQENGVVTVATSRLFDTSGLDELRMACGLDVRPALAPANEISRWISTLLGV